jgi:hypothetical protein
MYTFFYVSHLTYHVDDVMTTLLQLNSPMLAIANVLVLRGHLSFGLC